MLWCGGMVVRCAVVVCGAGGSEKFIFNFFLSGFYIKPQFNQLFVGEIIEGGQTELDYKCKC